MFKNIEYAAADRRDKNIDIISVKQNIAWVIDGANSLFPMHISSSKTDADWFVTELNQAMKKNLDTMKDPLELLYHARAEVMKRFEALGEDEIMDMEYPNAAIAMVYAHDQQLSYYVLGPCEIVFHFHDGSTQSIMDMRLPHMDARLTSICRNLREKQHIPLYQIRTFMDHMMIENRLHRNLPGGYFLLAEDESVSKEMICGAVPLDAVQAVSLVCHGFEEYYHPLRMEASLEEYIFVKRTQELVRDYERSLKNQAGNTNLTRYVQEQLSRPSTFVSFEVSKEMIAMRKAP